MTPTRSAPPCPVAPREAGFAKLMLALPKGAALPDNWPVPQLVVPPQEIASWRETNSLGTAPAVALAPGSVGKHKRWPFYAEAAQALVADGYDVWVVGGPGEKEAASEIVAAAGSRARDLTGTDLRQGILALAAARLAISNDSGLMHGAVRIPGRAAGDAGAAQAGEADQGSRP